MYHNCFCIMAAKTMSSTDPFDFSPCQQTTGLVSPGDEKVFFSDSDLPTAASNKKLSIFTHVHSLEIPDIDIDEDFPMVDLDLDLQDTPDSLNVCTSGMLLLAEVPNELENSRTLGRNEDHGLTSNTSTGLLNIKGCTFNAEKPTRTKRISTKQKIDTLRGEINELTIQLQNLEFAALHQKQLDDQQESNERLRPNHLHLWKLIASKQLEQRQRSEKENIELRRMMETQIQEARCLRRVLSAEKELRCWRLRCRQSVTSNTHVENR